MRQLSLFSADTSAPAIADLAGLLAGAGQVALALRGGARLSVVVEDSWRADLIAEMITESGFQAEITQSGEGRPLVRTEVSSLLTRLALNWTRGAVKSVPNSFVPTSRALRMWAYANGRPDGSDRFFFGLDPHAPQTHDPLARSLMRAGMAATLVGARGSAPGLRITGRRRLSKLLDAIGEPPEASGWDEL
ncbi:MAG: hypothetical protein LLG14_23485 [Nocardiaceae bacterium]|nr:hypothetical protein [Nocardiaceae bacterium]